MVAGRERLGVKAHPYDTVRVNSGVTTQELEDIGVEPRHHSRLRTGVILLGECPRPGHVCKRLCGRDCRLVADALTDREWLIPVSMLKRISRMRVPERPIADPGVITEEIPDEMLYPPTRSRGSWQ